MMNVILAIFDGTVLLTLGGIGLFLLVLVAYAHGWQR
jgi:hypothetical protein